MSDAQIFPRATSGAPPELMLLIFGLLWKQSMRSPYSPNIDIQSTLAASTRVCRRWRHPATQYLYKHVAVTTQRSFDRLIQTLGDTSFGEAVECVLLTGFRDQSRKTFRIPKLMKDPHTDDMEKLLTKCPNTTIFVLDVPSSSKTISVPTYLPRDILSNLISLSIGPTAPVHWLMTTIARGLIDLPRLDELRLSGDEMTLSGWNPFPRLQRLSLTDMKASSESLCSLLVSASSSLRDLSFTNFQTINHTYVSWPKLPHLRRITCTNIPLFGDQLVSLISSTALDIEDLELFDVTVDRDTWPALPRLCGLAIHVRAMNLSIGRGYQSLIKKVSTGSPSLKSLSIRGHLNIRTVELVNALTSPKLFASLEHLELLDTSPHPCDFQIAWAGMSALKSLRLRLPRPSSEPYRHHSDPPEPAQIRLARRTQWVEEANELGCMLSEILPPSLESLSIHPFITPLKSHQPPIADVRAAAHAVLAWFPEDEKGSRRFEAAYYHADPSSATESD